MVVDDVATRAEEARDLKRQLGELAREEQQEIIFKETSPRRRKVRIYSLRDGEPLDIPRYMLDAALNKMEDGQYMFTAKKELAPEWKLGTTKCFLHPESPDRPILDQIGLSGVQCPAAHLAGPYVRLTHAQHRHQQEWKAFQAYLEEQKEAKAIERQERQLEATLALARSAAGVGPAEPEVAEVVPVAGGASPLPPCECGWEVRSDSKNPQASMDTHKRLHCELRSRE